MTPLSTRNIKKNALWAWQIRFLVAGVNWPMLFEHGFPMLDATSPCTLQVTHLLPSNKPHANFHCGKRKTNESFTNANVMPIRTAGGACWWTFKWFGPCVMKFALPEKIHLQMVTNNTKAMESDMETDPHSTIIETCTNAQGLHKMMPPCRQASTNNTVMVPARKCKSEQHWNNGTGPMTHN